MCAYGCFLEPEIGIQFDEKIAELLRKLDEAYRKLNDRVMQVVLSKHKKLLHWLVYERLMGVLLTDDESQIKPFIADNASLIIILFYMLFQFRAFQDHQMSLKD